MALTGGYGRSMTTSTTCSGTGAARFLFVCPACGKGSNHPDDAANRYCGACRWWTGDPVLAAARPDLFPPGPAAVPAEQSRSGIRGYTPDLVILDEAWPPPEPSGA